MSAPHFSPEQIAALEADPVVRQHEVSLLTSTWIPFGFVLLVMIARFYVRITRRSLGVDDWTMLFAWVLYTICTIMSTVLVRLKAFHHIATLTLPQLQQILKVGVINQLIGIGIICISKMAVGFLLIRIINGTSDRWRRVFLYVNIWLYALISGIIIITTATQCNPPRALWHPEWILAGLATCPRQDLTTKFGLWHSIVGAWMDFMLALLPITFIYKMNISLKKKIAIACLLGLGIFAGVTAIMKSMQFAHGFTSADPTFNTYEIWFWASLEMPFVIIGGSVPPAKPVFDALFKGIPVSQIGSSRQTPTTSRKGLFSSSWKLTSGSSKDQSQNLGYVSMLRKGGSSSSSDNDSKTAISKDHHPSSSIVVEKSVLVEHGRYIRDDEENGNRSL